jgi:hypothetical protein
MILTRIDIGFSCVRHGENGSRNRERTKTRKKSQVGGTRGGRKAAPPSSLISRFRPFALSRFPDNYAEVSNCRWNPMILTRIDIGFSRGRHGGTDHEKKQQVGGTRGGRKAAPPSSLISRFRPFALSRFPDNYAEVSNCRWNPMILTRIDIGFSRVRHGGTDREKRASRRNARRAESCPSVLSDFALSPFRAFAIPRQLC